MLEKLNDLIGNDELLLHKAGLALGSLVGIFLGAVISKRADDFEQPNIYDVVTPEEVPSGPAENTPESASE